MPSEIRQLVFTQAELRTAFLEFNRRCGDALPSQAITAIREAESQAADITFDLDGGGSADIKRAKLAAALILYCKLNKIPLPVGGEKSISVNRGLIVLTVRMSDATRRQALLPAAGRA